MPKPVSSQKSGYAKPTRNGPDPHGKKIQKKIEEAAYVSQAPTSFKVNEPGKNNMGAANEMLEMPARYFKPHTKDSYWYLKDQMASVQRPAPLTDEEVRSIFDKQTQKQTATFEEWFLRKWPTNSGNPVMQEWAQKIMPEAYDRREAVIDEYADIQKKLAKMHLRGIHSIDDLYLAYQIETGALDVDKFKQPLWDLKGESATQTFKRGWFNPLRLKSWKINPTFTGTPDQFMRRNLRDDAVMTANRTNFLNVKPVSYQEGKSISNFGNNLMNQIQY